MLDNLRTGLRGAIKKIVGASDINEELIDSLCKDIQRALLQSDVNVKLVLEITKRIKERAIKRRTSKRSHQKRPHNYYFIRRTCKTIRIYRPNDQKHR